MRARAQREPNRRWKGSHITARAYKRQYGSKSTSHRVQEFVVHASRALLGGEARRDGELIAGALGL